MPVQYSTVQYSIQYKINRQRQSTAYDEWIGRCEETIKAFLLASNIEVDTVAGEKARNHTPSARKNHPSVRINKPSSRNDHPSARKSKNHPSFHISHCLSSIIVSVETNLFLGRIRISNLIRNPEFFRIRIRILFVVRKFSNPNPNIRDSCKKIRIRIRI